ncbi:hypothetical protein NA57DRAFT_58024 [Rhizodiscina lignyota]|uniref:Proteasome assembly chaperone 3 n=1 Tax=Rhizodiscina lignyota TaxID=1504668 RepID=A0A9P4M537_9PEZI|nr:hypothetical protein NA57DRAFT_58024 [Rhizodiscina lignyota]
MASRATFEVQLEPFPARSRTAAGKVNGLDTEIMSMSFADKILITISQGGRLAHWIHVPLDTTSPDPTTSASANFSDDPDAMSSDLLPRVDLTATTVLGGTVPERNTVGQLVATQTASAITTKNPDEKRLLVMGLGLEKAELDRAAFMDLLELVLGIV